MIDPQKMIEINKAGWNRVAHQFFEGSFDVLSYGPFAPTEEELHLLGSVAGDVIVEMGCGSGHTLEYLAKRGASELWGVDLSGAQIETAKQVTSDVNIPVRFIEAPMEDIPGLPMNYFDKAVSIYALGWTVHLQKTLSNIYKSLKNGGTFIFSWEHPIHSAVEYSHDRISFRRSYHSEGFEKHESWRNVPIVMQKRKVSTFINELVSGGFIIDRIIEESKVDETDAAHRSTWYSAAKASMIPSTLIIKCHKA